MQICIHQPFYLEDVLRVANNIVYARELHQSHEDQGDTQRLEILLSGENLNKNSYLKQQLIYLLKRYSSKFLRMGKVFFHLLKLLLNLCLFPTQKLKGLFGVLKLAFEMRYMGERGIQNIHRAREAGGMMQIPVRRRQSVLQFRLINRIPMLTISCIIVLREPLNLVSAISLMQAGAAMTNAPPEKPVRKRPIRIITTL